MIPYIYAIVSRLKWKVKFSAMTKSVPLSLVISDNIFVSAVS